MHQLNPPIFTLAKGTGQKVPLYAYTLNQTFSYPLTGFIPHDQAMIHTPISYKPPSRL